MSNKDEGYNREWVNQFSKDLVVDVLTKVKGEGDLEFQKILLVNFLASFIGALVYKTLRERPARIKTNKEMYEYAKSNFNEAKIDVQDAVAAGFQGAMEIYTGHLVEYYCQVKTVPPAKNNQVC